MVSQNYCSENYCLAKYMIEKNLHQGYYINIDMKCEVMPNPSFKKSMTKLCWKHDEKSSSLMSWRLSLMQAMSSFSCFTTASKSFLTIPLSTKYLKSHQISFLLSLFFAALRKVAHKRMDKNWAAWWSHVPEINISN